MKTFDNLKFHTGEKGIYGAEITFDNDYTATILPEEGGYSYLEWYNNVPLFGPPITELKTKEEITELMKQTQEKK